MSLFRYFGVLLCLSLLAMQVGARHSAGFAKASMLAFAEDANDISASAQAPKKPPLPPVPPLPPLPPLPPMPGNVITVGLHDDSFQPADLTISPGTTVRWQNHGRHAHTVTAKDGSWDSGPMRNGAVYERTFKKPGTYLYHCRFHSKQMRGRIVVSK